MISESYKQLYGGGGGPSTALQNSKMKEKSIMSSLKKVQNELCAELFNKIQEPIRKRTLSKTPDKSTIEQIRKSLNIESQNHKIYSQNILDSSNKEIHPRTSSSSSSSSYASILQKTPQGSKLQKLSFSSTLNNNNNNRSKSPQLSKSGNKILFGQSTIPFNSESNYMTTQISSDKNQSNQQISPQTTTTSQVVQSQSPHLGLSKEQMRLFYEQEKKKNQEQLDDLVRCSQEVLMQQEFGDINNIHSSDTNEFVTSSFSTNLPNYEMNLNHIQTDSRLTTSESQVDYQIQQFQNQSQIQQQQQQCYQISKPNYSNIGQGGNNDFIKSQQTPKREEIVDKTKSNNNNSSSNSKSKTFISFRKNSRSPIPRNSQPQKDKSPAVSRDKSNIEIDNNYESMKDQSYANQIRNKQVSFSQDIFEVEKHNTPKLNEFEELLSLVKKEKQIILNEIKYLTEQRNKYKSLYEEELDKQQDSQPQIDQTKSAAFKKVMKYLDTIGQNTGNFLKIQQKQDNLEQVLSTVKNKDEVIQVQKIVINKLLAQLNTKSNN